MKKIEVKVVEKCGVDFRVFDDRIESEALLINN